jgi:hypothetical protein
MRGHRLLLLSRPNSAITLRAATQSLRSTGAFNVKSDNRVSGLFHATRLEAAKIIYEQLPPQAFGDADAYEHRNRANVESRRNFKIE